jgi:hypothetical protein
MASNRNLDWEWQPPDILAELNADAEIMPPETQPQETQASNAAAA